MKNKWHAGCGPPNDLRRFQRASNSYEKEMACWLCGPPNDLQRLSVLQNSYEKMAPNDTKMERTRRKDNNI